MDLDIRQYKNRYGQNGLEGDVSKSKRSTSRPGGKDDDACSETMPSTALYAASPVTVGE